MEQFDSKKNFFLSIPTAIPPNLATCSLCMKDLMAAEPTPTSLPHHIPHWDTTALDASTTNVGPPIHKLPSDILWRIFSLNADLDEDSSSQQLDENATPPAVDTLRHTSQVCSTWRNLLLSSASLWGQVIDVAALARSKRDWREEVLRRTGQSPLCILGSRRQGGLVGHEKLAMYLIDRYWTRIRWLELKFTTDAWADCGRDVWEIFQRPAKALQVFRVMLLTYEHADEIHTPILSDDVPDFAVFGNVAPLLRVFYAPNIGFKLNAPWLTHLRFLSLNEPVSALDLLHAIMRMPMLEGLADEDSNAITHTGCAPTSLPRIAAPSLNRIHIASYLNLRPYMDFLGHIEPGAGRSLCFTYTGAVPDAETLDLANHVFKTYSRCCDLASATEIFLGLFPHRFQFDAIFPSGNTFIFDLNFTDDQVHDHSPSTILALFSTLPLVTFEDVRTLSLVVSPSVIQHTDSRLAKFILSLTSIDILYTTPETLSFLVHRPSDILAKNFPLLQKVEFTVCPKNVDWPLVKLFLSSRISMGKPILALGILVRPDDCADLRYLEEFTGLNVTFNFEGEEYLEYRCGDGHPEDLIVGG